MSATALRFLIDNGLSPAVAMGLRQAGHDAVHVGELGMAQAADEVLFDLAADQKRVLVSLDTDFGTLLSQRQSSVPSVILLRRSNGRRPEFQLRLILSNLGQLSEPLAEGAIVVFDDTRIRIRKLPLARLG